MISILTPTRNSPKQFESLVKSLHETCSDKMAVEILVKIDDDTNDGDYVEKTLRKAGFRHTILSNHRGQGYLDINRYVDELYKISSGLVVWLVMDDIVVGRGDWVKCLMSTRDKIADNIYIAYPKYASKMSYFKIEKFRGSGNGVPALSREMYDKISNYGISYMPFDRYIRGISRSLPDRIFYLDVHVAQKFSSRQIRPMEPTISAPKITRKGYDNIVESMGLKCTRRSFRRRAR